MFWGCFNYAEMGSLVNFNHNVYIELLDNQVLPFAYHLTEEHDIPIPAFQDDNSQVHRVVNVTDWHDLDQPAKSPDFCPLENLWNSLEQRVRRQGSRNLAELRNSLMPEWLNFDVAYIQKPVQSKPHRIAVESGYYMLLEKNNQIEGQNLEKSSNQTKHVVL